MPVLKHLHLALKPLGLVFIKLTPTCLVAITLMIYNFDLVLMGLGCGRRNESTGFGARDQLGFHVSKRKTKLGAIH